MPITKASSNAVAPAAKGDLVVGNATNDSGILAVGTTDQVLTVDSSTATGLKWATASAGGMTLISEQTASSNSSLSFSSIPGTYKQLMLVWSGIYHSATGSYFSIRLNNNSTADIYQGNMLHFLTNVINSVLWFSDTAIQKLGSDGNTTAPFGNSATNSTTTPFVQSNGSMLIDNYASTSKTKFFHTEFGYYGTSIGHQYTEMNGVFNSTSAVTSIDIVRMAGSATFSNATNTSIRLYGIS